MCLQRDLCIGRGQERKRGRRPVCAERSGLRPPLCPGPSAACLRPSAGCETGANCLHPASVPPTPSPAVQMITRSMIPVVPRMLLDLQQHSFKKFEMNSCYSLPLSCNLKRIYVHIIFEFPKNSPHLNTSDSRHLVHIH